MTDQAPNAELSLAKDMPDAWQSLVTEVNIHERITS